MPIGKNAIKRVENNGYSKVATSAPDMENSNIIANPDPQVVEKLIAPVEAAETPVETVVAPVKRKRGRPAKNASAKTETTPKTTKKPAAKKPATKKTTAKAAKKSGWERVEVGEAMPYYLL